MPRRNGWRKGDWLVVDEESGITRYASQVRQDWKGVYVTRRFSDDEQPQDFVRPLDDPGPLPFMVVPDRTVSICNVVPLYVGNTNILTNLQFAAAHLYEVTATCN